MNAIRQKILKIMDLALKISPPDRERKLGETVVFAEEYSVMPKKFLRLNFHIKNGVLILIILKELGKLQATFREDEFEQLNEIIEYLQDLREAKQWSYTTLRRGKNG